MERPGDRSEDAERSQREQDPVGPRVAVAAQRDIHGQQLVVSEPVKPGDVENLVVRARVRGEGVVDATRGEVLVAEIEVRSRRLQSPGAALRPGQAARRSFTGRPTRFWCMWFDERLQSSKYVPPSRSHSEKSAPWLT